MTITFGSVCSGIEAASVAWHPLGWRAAWLAEIEPFPCAVLAHHYPNTPNLGDMTTIAARVASGDVPAPDVFCGGTPCQAFSIAGLRKSLDDARGNLSLTFCEIANAIDTARHVRGEQPAVIFWENVPGVLNTKDNAFGCFLAGLAGEDDPLVPPREKWTNAGFVLGPKRAIAWRVFDAQYFGVAQRRRRVFVVASAREGFDPAAVLFEFDGLRRDTAPRREAREGAARGAARGARGGGPAVGVSPTLRAGGNKSGGDRPPGTDVDTADSLVITLAHGQGGAEIGFDRGPTLTCNHEAPIAAYTTKLHNTSSNQAGKFYEEYSTSLDANSPPPAVVFQERGREGGRSLEIGGEVAFALTAPAGGGRAQERNVLTPSMQVRRLTPEECEALQGFPRSYTQIPWRKKPAADCPDGPRYKALGNSWAVPNVAWIGRRIHNHLTKTTP